MIDQFSKYCEENLDLQNATLSDGYYYSSLPLCVIDSVYSIGVRYTSTRKTVENYCNYYKIPLYRERTSCYPNSEVQHTIKEFISNLEENSIDFNAKHVFSNLQRTSSKSGILKAEAVYLWAKVLENSGVNVFQDVHMIDYRTKNKLLAIKGQQSGLSLSYFYMLSGNDDLSKPDRHVLNFISNALQRRVNDTALAQRVITDAVATLKDKYPHLTVRLLDNTIWKYMSR